MCTLRSYVKYCKQQTKISFLFYPWQIVQLRKSPNPPSPQNTSTKQSVLIGNVLSELSVFICSQFVDSIFMFLFSLLVSFSVPLNLSLFQLCFPFSVFLNFSLFQLCFPFLFSSLSLYFSCASLFLFFFIFFSLLVSVHFSVYFVLL